MTEQPPFQRVALIGLGMMNASLAAALKTLPVSVVGYARRSETREEALSTGLFSEVFDRPLEAVRDADLVVLGTPVCTMPDVLKALLPGLAVGSIVTDQGSTKGWLVDELTLLVSEAGGEFIGSHPMCGSEQQGLGAANAGLFAGAPLILTPTASTSATALKRLEGFWMSLDMRLLSMDAALHDALVAEVSHVPHLLATALALSASQHPEAGQRLNEVRGSGFDCMTRMALGSPSMWHDILKTNATPIRESLVRVRGFLEEFESLLEEGEFDAARVLLEEGVEARARVMEQANEC